MRLLLVEDEEDLVVSLARVLRGEGYALDIARDGQEALELIELNQYDLVLLDLGLPGPDGLEVLRVLRRSGHPVPVLVLTARASVADRVQGLDTGADDYQVKPFHIEELLARVRALLRRDLKDRSPLLRCGEIALDPATHTAWKGSHRLELTRREFAVLHYLLARAGEVVSQEELLEHVWGSEADPFSNVVRVHIHSLRRKLGDTARGAQFLETVPGVGYRLRAE
jgi:DNA-binding response OmpR family regulator